MEMIGSHLTSARDKEVIERESNKDSAHLSRDKVNTADLLPKTRIKKSQAKDSQNSSVERPPSMDQKMTAEDLKESQNSPSRNAGTHNFESAHKGNRMEEKMMQKYRSNIEKGSTVVMEGDAESSNRQAPTNASMNDGTLKFSSIREIRSPKAYKIKTGSQSINRKGKSQSSIGGPQTIGNESQRRRPAPSDVGYFQQKGSNSIKNYNKDVAENRMYMGAQDQISPTTENRINIKIHDPNMQASLVNRSRAKV